MSTQNVEVPDRLPLNGVKYTTKDFATFFDSLLRRLKIEYGEHYNNFASSSVGIMLVDLMAYGLSQLAWSTDRRASDTYLPTARTREAVERIVSRLAYKTKPAAASSTFMQMTFPDGVPANYLMRKGFRYSGPDNLIFETTSDLELSASSAPVVKSVNCRQGVTRLLEYTSTGAKNQTYRLSSVPADKFLAEYSVICFVDGQEWEEHDFLNFTQTNHFEVSYNSVPPLVRFGDGVSGNMPPSGASIRFQFVVIDGSKGNVQSGTIQKALDKIVIDGVDVKFSVTNPNRSSGGMEPDSIEKTKKFAPYVFAARGACITAPDFMALSSTFTDPQYGKVAKAYSYVIRRAEDDDVLNGFLGEVRTILGMYVLDAATREQLVVSLTNSMNRWLTAMLENIAAIEAIRAETLVPQVGSIRNGALSIKQVGNGVVGDMSAAQNVLSAMNVKIALITGGAGVKTSLETLSDQLSSLLGAASVKGSTVMSIADSILGSTATLLDVITGVAPKVTIEALVDALMSEAASMAIDVQGLIAMASTMVGTASAVEGSVLAKNAEMKNYLSGLFDHDSKANVVHVPILTQLRDGTYVAPSTGLIQSLQQRLNDISEVTQLPIVIDGSYNLLPLNVDIDVKVSKTFVVADVLSQVEVVVAKILTGRDFNQPLYKYVLDTLIENKVSGVAYANVRLWFSGSDPVVNQWIDAAGNCIPPKHRIITRGILAIKEIK